MKSVIRGEELAKHKIEKYDFLHLDAIEEENRECKKGEDKKEEGSVEKEKEEISVSKDREERSSEDDKKMVEELLKKIEELSSTIVELQMQNESLTKEFDKRLEEEKKSIYEEAEKKSKESVSAQVNAEMEAFRNRFLESIQNLNEYAQKVEEFYIKMEEELPKSALEIAKEVIAKEVSENSREIALSLSKALIKDLKDATKITLKVNPNEFNYIKENFQENSIVEVVPDESVSEGGVLILSDIGNIEGTIEERIKNIEKLLLSS